MPGDRAPKGTRGRRKRTLTKRRGALHAPMGPMNWLDKRAGTRGCGQEKTKSLPSSKNRVKRSPPASPSREALKKVVRLWFTDRLCLSGEKLLLMVLPVNATCHRDGSHAANCGGQDHPLDSVQGVSTGAIRTAQAVLRLSFSTAF